MSVVDLKENIEFTSYEIEHQAGVLAKEFTLVTPELDTPYTIGQDIVVTIFGVEESVHIGGIRQVASERGWATELRGFGMGYDLMTKAPKKTRSYLSMTYQEYTEFMWEYGGTLGKTIDHLDYVPLIQTADDYGCGAWSAKGIMEDLAGQLDLSLYTNIMDYDVRQFTINAGSPFIEAITELVSIFDPVVYFVEDILFVLEGLSMEAAVMGGTYLPDQCAALSQEIVDAAIPDQLVVTGVLGQFFPEKYRGYAENISLYSDDPGEAFTGSFEFYGIPRMDSGTYVEQDYGGVDYERRVARDVHGNDYFQYYEKRLTTEVKWLQEGDSLGDLVGGEPYWTEINHSGYYEIETVLEEQFDYHIYTHWKYGHPVEAEQEKVISGMVWRPSTQQEIDVEWIEGPLYTWEWQLSYEYTEYGYSGQGQQTTINRVKYELCLSDYEESEEYGTFITPLSQLTRAESEEYVLDEDVWVGYYLTEWTSRVQIPLSRETYGLVTVGQRLAGLREDEVTGEVYLDYQAITPTIDIVQAGGHQGSAPELRKMETYFGTGLSVVGDPEEADKVLNTVARTVSVNCSNWEHLEQIHERLLMFAGYKKIVREYEMPIMYPLTIGLPVVMGDLSVGVDQTLSTPSAIVGAPVDGPGSGIVTGYRISKEAGSPNGRVSMTVRACLDN